MNTLLVGLLGYVAGFLSAEVVKRGTPDGLRRWPWWRMLAGFTALGLLVVYVQVLGSSQQNQRQTNCNGRIIRRSLAALDEQRATTKAAKDAQDGVFTSLAVLSNVLVNPKATARQRSAAFLQFVTVLNAYNMAQTKKQAVADAHPLPSEAQVAACFGKE